ncbi:chaperone modulator CbpM [Actinoallomurus purpureus]|uniref:chaperone modulator CbpM n=1 Tax=Actinoallomurus purpureus TaxID=478114 RepID=UPI002092C8D1|nr:chaperone modulator CbpM [Actinoallomurus purpureus]MCO6008165.1 chaperone modulator CbpM [Actinoallomurus purpureus]
MRYALVRPARPVPPVRFDLETFARAAWVHPELVRRLVVLGILDAERDASGALWLARDQFAVLARVQRLRADFSLNYAALGLVCDLLDRIAALEAAQRRVRPRPGDRSWT